MPGDETSSQPPNDPGSMSWESTTNYNPRIAQDEHRRWATFLAQIATSSGDAGVLGNFPQEVEQEVERLMAIHAKEIERLKEMHAQMDAKKDAKLAFETERAEEYKETVLKQEKRIENLFKDFDLHEWRIPPPPPN